MEHQYPGAISGDENMLAELMLPDQAHVRKQDWTIFFLHKDTSDEDEKEEGAEGGVSDGQILDDADRVEGQAEGHAGQKTATPDTSKDPEDVEGGEGPPLIYVLNLVNTKQDTTATRFQLCPLTDIYDHCLTWYLQRCCRQSHGHMYKTFFPSYLQGTRSNLTRHGMNANGCD